MCPALEDQVKSIEHTIAELEAQREFLGNKAVDLALAPFLRKLDELQKLLQTHKIISPGMHQPQRKLVTMLFMDIVGSTSIAQHMDPEDVSEVFDLALRKLSQPVDAHDGHVTRFMGDGFLAVFGAQIAREDDPERAVRAGLAIIELAQGISVHLKQRWRIQDFQVRVGINSGMVMLGGDTESENTLMGAAVNLAARLESSAPAGGLLVSHDTYRHIRGVFDVEPWELLQVKGFDTPVRAYRILRARPRAFRLYTRGVEGIETRMVGRAAELKYLQDALLSAMEESEGQIITITGEAGVGKSRLLYEFEDWIELLPPPAIRFFEGRANSEAQNLPYGMLRDLFAFRFQIQDDDRIGIVRDKIMSGFGEVFGSYPDGEMRTHLLGQWLGFDFSSSSHLKGVLDDPEQLRNRGLLYIEEYLRVISSQQPVVIFLEDIHWADDSSLDVLNWLGERLHRQQLVIVCAARPLLFERRPYWGEGLAYHHCIKLEPLSKRESRQLVSEILKLADQVPLELRELVVEGAEGNPFYVEELIKMLVEDGIIIKGDETWYIYLERLAEISVPPTLAGVLQARLDCLSAQERTVLQQASVVGRLFWDGVIAYIQAAEGGQENIIPEALMALRSRELIYRREESAFSDAYEFVFKHDILREVTYESVLKRMRKIYHGLVADWLLAHGAERMAEFSGLIAGHLLEAGRKEQAAEYFLRAGETALKSYANGEAEVHFRMAGELVTGRAQRAACLAGLGEVLSRQGTREEAARFLREAITLYEDMGKHDQMAHLYTRLSQVLWYVDYAMAWDACQEGLKRLESAPDGPGLARLLAEAGRAAYYRSQPAKSIASLCQQAIDVADRTGDLEAKAEASITIASSIREVDPDRSISILQEVIALSEANRLWDQAARAYFSLFLCMGENYQNLESLHQYQVRAVQISAQIGNLDKALLAMENVAQSLIELGQLKTMEASLAELLRICSAPPARAEEFLNDQRAWILYYTGEWAQALEYHRQRVFKLRQGGSYQFIALHNLMLAYTSLELNHFLSLDNLSEAEAALRENIEMNWLTQNSLYSLAVVSVRQNHLDEAKKRLADAATAIASPETTGSRILRFETEVELAMAERRGVEAVSICQVLVDIHLAGGYRWQHARKLVDLGDALALRDLPGDRQRALETYQQSLKLFSEMGSPGYIRVLEERSGRMSRCFY